MQSLTCHTMLSMLPPEQVPVATPCTRRRARRSSRGIGWAAWVMVFAGSLGPAPTRAQLEPNTSADAQAKAIDAAHWWRELSATVQLAAALKIHVPRTTLREGEELQLTVEVPREGFLHVLGLPASGEPVLLLPNAWHPRAPVTPGPFVLPTPQMAFALRASPPHGRMLLVALLSDTPLELGEPTVPPGSPTSGFTRISQAGRALIEGLQYRALAEGHGPLLAGSASLTTCPPQGTCAEAPASTVQALATAAGGVLRVLDAFAPGVLLEEPAAVDKQIALRTLSPAGLRLVKVSEGFVPQAYHDAAGYCTIAYGHLIRRSGCNEGGLPAAFRGRISEARGSELLLEDLQLAQRAVTSAVTVPLTDGQFAALTDFTFNVGAGNLRRSKLLRVLNAGQYDAVPAQLRRWVQAGGKVWRGLQTRREREVALFQGLSFKSLPPRAAPADAVDIRSGESE